MPVVQVPTNEIDGWESFHTVFQRVLGFPDFTSADSPDDRMIADELIAGEGDVLTLQLEDVVDFAERCPEQYEAVIECSAFVNWRRIEVGERPILALSFSKPHQHA